MATAPDPANLPEAPFGFDPTYGYSLPQLLEIGCPLAPADFESFWRETYQEATAAPARPTCRQIGRDDLQNIYEVEFDAWNLPGQQPFRVGGWMTVPAHDAVRSGVVVGHGYGGRAGPDLFPALAEAAAIYPCARGFNRSARPELPNQSDAHVLFGIESRETYIHRACVTDIWAAVTALTEVVPDAGRWMTYSGVSFGGGIGAMAVPWDNRLRRAFLDVPSFGQHPIRFTLPCVGSGEAIRRAGGERLLRVLQYFDSAVAATFTTIPTLVAAAEYDPAVPPPGQFAVYNCLAGEKDLFVRRAAHIEYSTQAEENARLAAHITHWLKPPGTVA